MKTPRPRTGCCFCTREWVDPVGATAGSHGIFDDIERSVPAHAGEDTLNVADQAAGGVIGVGTLAGAPATVPQLVEEGGETFLAVEVAQVRDPQGIAGEDAVEAVQVDDPGSTEDTGQESLVHGATTHRLHGRVELVVDTGQLGVVARDLSFTPSDASLELGDPVLLPGPRDGVFGVVVHDGHDVQLEALDDHSGLSVLDQQLMTLDQQIADQLLALAAHLILLLPLMVALHVHRNPSETKKLIR